MSKRRTSRTYIVWPVFVPVRTLTPIKKSSLRAELFGMADIGLACRNNLVRRPRLPTGEVDVVMV